MVCFLVPQASLPGLATGRVVIRRLSSPWLTYPPCHGLNPVLPGEGFTGALPFGWILGRGSSGPLFRASIPMTENPAERFLLRDSPNKSVCNSHRIGLGPKPQPRHRVRLYKMKPAAFTRVDVGRIEPTVLDSLLLVLPGVFSPCPFRGSLSFARPSPLAFSAAGRRAARTRFGVPRSRRASSGFAFRLGSRRPLLFSASLTLALFRLLRRAVRLVCSACGIGYMLVAYQKDRPEA